MNHSVLLSVYYHEMRIVAKMKLWCFMAHRLQRSLGSNRVPTNLESQGNEN